jgi:hypothetical protein
MNPLGATLIIAGIVLIMFGLALSGRLGPLGRLPGDITITRPGFTFSFPLATSLLISVILTLIMWLWAKIRS